MPVEGREIPDSSAGGQSPQTLKSFLCSLKGECAKRISASRFASFSNFAVSDAVYPSPKIKKSTFVDGSPFFWNSSRGAGDFVFERSTNISFGSTRNVQISLKALFVSRFFKMI